MGLSIRVKLADDVSFSSKAEQDELAEAIDAETFTSPLFVGSAGDKRYGDVGVEVGVSNLETKYADKIGEIVADHFDTDLETVRIDR